MTRSVGLSTNLRHLWNPFLSDRSPAGELERYPAYAKHSEAAPEWYEFCRTLTRKMSAEPMPADCERIVESVSGWLITLEK